jgi:hypothetical protein
MHSGREIESGACAVASASSHDIPAVAICKSLGFGTYSQNWLGNSDCIQSSLTQRERSSNAPAHELKSCSLTRANIALKPHCQLEGEVLCLPYRSTTCCTVNTSTNIHLTAEPDCSFEPFAQPIHVVARSPGCGPGLAECAPVRTCGQLLHWLETNVTVQAAV